MTPVGTKGEKWFELDVHGTESTITASNGLGFVSPTVGERFVQVDRLERRDCCCGCCGCFANCCRGGTGGGGEWRGIDGRLRGRRGGVGMLVVFGGVVFVVALVAMALLVLLVWSLDSFGDGLDGLDALASEELGSGSGA
jgi:hypothetical protein